MDGTVGRREGLVFGCRPSVSEPTGGAVGVLGSSNDNSYIAIPPPAAPNIATNTPPRAQGFRKASLRLAREKPMSAFKSSRIA